jgi:hypothetical protein
MRVEGRIHCRLSIADVHALSERGNSLFTEPIMGRENLQAGIAMRRDALFVT